MSGSALPHPVGLQPQAATVAARRAPEKKCSSGTNVAERSWLGSRSGLVFLLRRACFSSRYAARHSNRSGSTTQKGKIRTQPILFALRPCIYYVLLHGLRVRTPTVAGKFTLPTTSGICPAFAGWFSNQAVTPAVATSVPWMKPGS